MMLRRHLPAGWEDQSEQALPQLGSPMSLWNYTRRNPQAAQRFPQVIERLAIRLSADQGGLYLRSDQARENHLKDLDAADRWWKRQWRVVLSHPGASEGA